VVRTLDGDIGKVHEFYFGDLGWIIRYLVVDTGTWLPGRRVLLSPAALGQPDWKSRTFPVRLTRGQVEGSPSIDAAKPVSRQMESELHAYYGWPLYWSGMGTVAAAPGFAAASKEQKDASEWANPHLRSSREVIGYHIQANDGQIGHVEDLIADDEAWIIRYLVIDTRNWLPGKEVLVATEWAEDVDWTKRSVHIDLSRDTVKTGPAFDPSAPVNREYEIQLYDFYGRPKYW
jgi:hypothetical protein